MKRLLIFSILVAFGTAGLAEANMFNDLFGTRLSRKAGRLEGKLQTPIMLKTDAQDQCAVEQLRGFLKDFRKATDAERAASIDALKKTAKIIVNPSIQVGTLTGRFYELQYISCHMSGSVHSRSCITYSKVIGNKTVVNGTTPKTKFFRPQAALELAITAESVQDDRITAVYRASQRSVYDRIKSVDSEDFRTAVEFGLITRSYAYLHDAPICGSASLQELAKAAAE